MKKRMKRKHRRLLGSLLSMLLLLSMSTSVFAAEPTKPAQTSATTLEAELVEYQTLSQGIIRQTEIGAQQVLVEYTTKSGTDTIVLPRSVYGYAAYDAKSSSGSFTVYAPGSAASSGGVTFKTSGFTEGTKIYMTLQRPDGTYAVSSVLVTANSEVYKTFSDSQVGTYTVYFYIYGTSLGQLHAWVY